MYGYPRLTILLNQKFSFNVSAGLIYRLMKELGIQSKEMEIGREIKSYDDFQNFVNDDQLIEGAYKIGVIGWEASKVLKHAKETRHIFSGHPSSTDPSIIKVFSMMDDCIKYVLNVEYPLQIIDIDEYMEILATESYDRNPIGVENAFGDLPDRYKNELSNRFFGSYIHKNSSTIMRSNIEFCSPILWKILPKPVKIQVVRRIDQEIIKGNGTTIRLAFQFIENVQAHEYLTLNAKKYKIEPLIEELEKNLDVFTVENRCVEELERFSNSIPIDLLSRYVNALTQTYIGHIGGSAYFARTDFYADSAALRIPEMFEKFDDTAADAFIYSIKINKKLKSRIKTPAKLRRLRSLANIVLERVSINYHNKEILESLVDESQEKEFFEYLRI
ncbi:hypothetical protein CKN63_13110 [Carnobacterium divergens]|uniref:IS3 family transposase n=1 Tax=Carnobacterium TaxID=2747 RepID=UPI00107201B2|nr:MULTISPECIES: IS3 family transposase [Carnobacterium]MDW5525319.1 transposase [Carnobacterium maltaromaticum]TFI60627.1 hypothetical protein CKN59_13050 [Carnobacterium divergens]TFI61469.1 hypothetical protein CKN76_13065 [Carnobacterium divergens]TFI77091.1 hypothetical protein CKN74_12945 [Carnobacterium divergens]TFJ01393.1 hypothetical protein CKN75_12390 [Carnobacterium divergens]